MASRAAVASQSGLQAWRGGSAGSGTAGEGPTRTMPIRPQDQSSAVGCAQGRGDPGSASCSMTENLCLARSRAGRRPAAADTAAASTSAERGGRRRHQRLDPTAINFFWARRKVNKGCDTRVGRVRSVSRVDPTLAVQGGERPWEEAPSDGEFANARCRGVGEQQIVDLSA